MTHEYHVQVTQLDDVSMRPWKVRVTVGLTWREVLVYQYEHIQLAIEKMVHELYTGL